MAPDGVAWETASQADVGSRGLTATSAAAGSRWRDVGDRFPSGGRSSRWRGGPLSQRWSVFAVRPRLLLLLLARDGVASPCSWWGHVGDGQPFRTARGTAGSLSADRGVEQRGKNGFGGGVPSTWWLALCVAQSYNKKSRSNGCSNLLTHTHFVTQNTRYLFD